MTILVNNRPVMIKEGTSFEYISENRAFSDADGFSLSITFPLSDCPQNIAVFGHLNRKDVEKVTLLADCTIIADNVSLHGCLAVIGIDETEVKCQFLQGRSVQNCDSSFDSVYINELDLGKPDRSPDLSPLQAYTRNVNEQPVFALPWVNSNSGLVQNKAIWTETPLPSGNSAYDYAWDPDCKNRSWMPNLLWLTRRICEAEGIGYTHDFSQWENTLMRYLLCCNTLPAAWGQPEFAAALPHWSLTEYFEKLGLLLGGDFEIDHAARHITFNSAAAGVEAAGTVALSDILDDYSVEIDTDERSASYLPAKNIVYAECDHPEWPFYSCPGIKRLAPPLYGSVFANMNDYMAYVRNIKYNPEIANPDSLALSYAYGTGLDYVADTDTYYLLKRVPCTNAEFQRWGVKVKAEPAAVNQFGGRIADESDQAEEVSIDFVPVRISETDPELGRMVFLPIPASDTDANIEYDSDNQGNVGPGDQISEDNLLQFAPYRLIKQEQSDKQEYFDRIYIGLWPGYATSYVARNLLGTSFRPLLDNVELNHRGGYWVPSPSDPTFTLRLDRLTGLRGMPEINPTQKFTFKFLSDTIPNPRAIFNIRGHLYVCQSITSTFSENGMSQLHKGVFYPLKAPQA